MLTCKYFHLLGQNGQNASDLNMSVAGISMDPDNLTIEVTDRGKSKSLCSFNTANQFILMRAAGGNAGQGGPGGVGGTGGADTFLALFFLATFSFHLRCKLRASFQKLDCSKLAFVALLCQFLPNCLSNVDFRVCFRCLFVAFASSYVAEVETEQLVVQVVTHSTIAMEDLVETLEMEEMEETEVAAAAQAMAVAVVMLRA